MSKQAFLSQLAEGLSGLPQEEIAERLAFYGEMIDDRTEEGLSEEDAVAAVGPGSAIVSQAVAEVPITRLVKERVGPKRRLQVWELVLLALGSPVWISLLLSALAVLLSVYLVIWAVILALWAVDVSCAACSLGALAAGILLLCRGDGWQGLCAVGAGIALAGLSILLFFGCRAATRGAFLLTKRIAWGIKSLFLRKENEG